MTSTELDAYLTVLEYDADYERSFERVDGLTDDTDLTGARTWNTIVQRLSV